MPFTRIEIHFDSNDNRKLTVIIEPGSAVEAIRLRPIPPTKRGPPPGVSVVDELGNVLKLAEDDGPGVCYEAGAQVHCW